LYHGANVLFRTTDAGKRWQKISPDLTRDDKDKQKWSGGPITGDNTGAEVYGTIFALAESPRKAGVLWAGSDDGLIHVSIDAGKTWTNVTPNFASAAVSVPMWGTVTCLEASPHDANTAYVVVDNHRMDDNRPLLWKTTNLGKAWTFLSAKLPQDDFVRVVREDPKMPGLLYLGSNTTVYFSRDAGVSWDKLRLNLPTAPVCDLVVKDNDLVVGTSGRSLWILDDLTPIRAWSDKLKAGPHLFPTQPAIRWRYHGGQYVSDRTPGENPPRGAIIQYYLDKDAKEDITLEITDASGRSVQKLSSKKQEPEAGEDDPDAPWSILKPTVLPKDAGLHRVTWDLKYAGAKIIPGAKNDGGEPRHGPFVLPGTYTLKLTVAGKTLGGTVQVLPDPRVKLPVPDLEKQLDLALSIRDGITRLSESVIKLRSIRKQIQDRKELLKTDSMASDWRKQADKVIAKL